MRPALALFSLLRGNTMMSNPVGTVVRGEHRHGSRERNGGELFDATRLLRPSNGSLRTPHTPVEPLEETLVIDRRGSIRPAQAVEHKLVALLDGKAVSVSQLRTAALSSRNRAAFD
jgi:hypothetical protein